MLPKDSNTEECIYNLTAPMVNSTREIEVNLGSEDFPIDGTGLVRLLDDTVRITVENEIIGKLCVSDKVVQLITKLINYEFRDGKKV